MKHHPILLSGALAIGLLFGAACQSSDNLSGAAVDHQASTVADSNSSTVASPQSLMDAFQRRAATERVNFQIMKVACGGNADCLSELEAFGRFIQSCQTCTVTVKNFNKTLTASQLRSGTVPTTFPRVSELMALLQKAIDSGLIGTAKPTATVAGEVKPTATLGSSDPRPTDAPSATPPGEVKPTATPEPIRPTEVRPTDTPAPAVVFRLAVSELIADLRAMPADTKVTWDLLDRTLDPATRDQVAPMFKQRLTQLAASDPVARAIVNGQAVGVAEAVAVLEKAAA